MKQERVFSAYQWVKLGILFSISLIISLFSLFPEQVERLYSLGIYPALASTLRTLTRWVPFSLGDILYAWIFLLMLIGLVRLLRLLYRRELTRARLILIGFSFLSAVLWVFIVFQLMWGLNYHRLGIAYQLRINKNGYSREEVTSLAHQLIYQLNECRRQIGDTVLPEPPLDTLYREAYRSYERVSYEYEFLHYQNRSVKPSLYSGIADYVGFTGYYNPFTGEAQLRTDLPRVLIPYITLHEMAHQLGYASESEANFVGFLAAMASKNVYVRYSAYLDLFSYAQGEQVRMYGKEKDYSQFEAMILQNRSLLDTLVKRDRKEIREFFYKRRNRISPAVSGLYDQYLKLNKQTEGVNSYNEVVGWLIAYQKKYGKL
ncbi:MAG: DUF3810 domain-containing protein [Bacteroidetes bacterium]|nr:DUF3810 domain-containing protein [Bacteroidota bacterium]